jgi:NADH-quinone oxidoreductase subunit N
MPFNSWFLALAVSGVLNSALSVYYYARVIWYMYVLEPSGEVTRVSAPRSIAAAVLVALAVVLLTAPFVGYIYSYLQSAASGFFGF